MSLITKSEIRARYKSQRESYTPELKAKRDDKIAESFLNLHEYKNRGKILVFISKDIEVNTDKIIARAFADNKTVAAPRCGSDNTMSFYVIESFDDLERGSYGLLEPKKSCRMLCDYDDSLCLVPALVYDIDLYRVGFGKGFYDRFLSNYSGVSVGVCYSDCIEDKLPKDSCDCPVEILVTDNKVIRKDNGYE